MNSAELNALLVVHVLVLACQQLWLRQSVGRRLFWAQLSLMSITAFAGILSVVNAYQLKSVPVAAIAGALALVSLFCSVLTRMSKRSKS